MLSVPRSLVRTQARCLGRQRAIVIRRNKTTTPSGGVTNPPVTAQDLQNLQQELKALQQLIREQQSQSYHVESLTRSVSAQSAQLEKRLLSIELHVSKISAVETMVSSMREVMQKNPAIRTLLENLKPVTPVVKRYKNGILGTLLAAALLWIFRAKVFYESASEEVADLARRTLEQESLRESIQETLTTVANNPSTLETLNKLIQQLIQNESTVRDLVDLLVHAAKTPEVQKTLVDVLQLVFEDPYLQELAGQFLLKGLDVPSVKAMLDAQTADLVRETVSNDSVQQAASGGVKMTFWYTITPPFLWGLIPKGKKVKDSTTRSGSETQTKGSEEHSNQYDQGNATIHKSEDKNTALSQ